MKGACLEEAGEKGAELIKSMGPRGKLLIKTDNEPALKALRDATIQRLDQQILPIKPPVAESASNGVIESGVRTFKGILRVHLLSLEKKLGGVKIPIKHPIIAWLVEYCADICSKYLTGADGKSAYMRLYGKRTNEAELEFGEQIMWRPQPSKDMNVVIDGRWRPGIWLGRNWGSSINRVGVDAREVVEARAVHRVSLEERWSIDNVQHLISVPWNWRPSEDAVPGVFFVPDDPNAVPAAPVERPYMPRNVYIKPADLVKFAYTSGCRRCMLMSQGRSIAGISHTSECRERITKLLAEAGDARVERAAYRATVEFARQVEA